MVNILWVAGGHRPFHIRWEVSVPSPESGRVSNCFDQYNTAEEIDTVYGLSSQETSSFCLLENSLLELWNHFQAIWQPCWSHHLGRPWRGRTVQLSPVFFHLCEGTRHVSEALLEPPAHPVASWLPTSALRQLHVEQKNYPAKAGTNSWPIDHEYNKTIAALSPWVRVNLLYSNRYSNYFIPRAPKKTQDSSSPYITVSGRILKLPPASPRFSKL